MYNRHLILEKNFTVFKMHKTPKRTHNDIVIKFIDKFYYFLHRSIAKEIRVFDRTIAANSSRVSAARVRYNKEQPQYVSSF